MAKHRCQQCVHARQMLAAAARCPCSASSPGGPAGISARHQQGKVAGRASSCTQAMHACRWASSRGAVQGGGHAVVTLQPGMLAELPACTCRSLRCCVVPPLICTGLQQRQAEADRAAPPMPLTAYARGEVLTRVCVHLPRRHTHCAGAAPVQHSSRTKPKQERAPASCAAPPLPAAVARALPPVRVGAAAAAGTDLGRAEQACREEKACAYEKAAASACRDKDEWRQLLQKGRACALGDGSGLLGALRECSAAPAQHQGMRPFAQQTIRRDQRGPHNTEVLPGRALRGGVTHSPGFPPSAPLSLLLRTSSTVWWLGGSKAAGSIANC